MLSIVIPTKNEEKYLPHLLKSIETQGFSWQDLEIIVADAGSTDRTRKIARKYGARIVDGGMPGVGRNRGAEVSRGEDILFLDADVILPAGFLRRNYSDFMRRDADIGTTLIKPVPHPADNAFYGLTDRIKDEVQSGLINFGYVLAGIVKHIGIDMQSAMGYNIFVNRRLFDKINGFDEGIKFGEDHDFVQRAKKAGAKFELLNGPPVHFSVRRQSRIGRIKHSWIGVRSLWHYAVKGPIYSDDFVKGYFS